MVDLCNPSYASRLLVTIVSENGTAPLRNLVRWCPLNVPVLSIRACLASRKAYLTFIPCLPDRRCRFSELASRRPWSSVQLNTRLAFCTRLRLITLALAIYCNMNPQVSTLCVARGKLRVLKRTVVLIALVALLMALNRLVMRLILATFVSPLLILCVLCTVKHWLKCAQLLVLVMIRPVHLQARKTLMIRL